MMSPRGKAEWGRRNGEEKAGAGVGCFLPFTPPSFIFFPGLQVFEGGAELDHAAGDDVVAGLDGAGTAADADHPAEALGDDDPAQAVDGPRRAGVDEGDAG